MALTFPYPLDQFSDHLRANAVTFSLERRDEHSGSGDGRVWSVQLSPPLWTAEVSLANRSAQLARDLEALIDGLDGSRGTFLFADPTYPGPASGSAGLGDVSIAGIRSDRGAVGLTGLPAGFVLTRGDRLSIEFASGRVYFGRFIEGGTASQAGNLGQREIRPYLPQGISAGINVELAEPRMKASIRPGGFTPFEYGLPEGLIARGASISIMQKP